MTTPRHSLRRCLDPETEVAMRLLDERRSLIRSVGEPLYRQRADEVRELIEERVRRTGEHRHEAALWLVDRCKERLSPAEERVYSALLMIVAYLEMGR